MVVRILRTTPVWRWCASVGLACALLLLWSGNVAAAHGVAQDDASFFLMTVSAAIGPFVYLGAKHMFPGYDHLLFLVAVPFFLYRIPDVVSYLSLFNLGPRTPLLAGLLWGGRANALRGPAVLGLSVG